MNGRKKIVASVLSVLFALSSSLSAVAVPFDWWYINYIPNAPASISNQDDRVYVDYYSGGFVADNISISGANGCYLTLVAENAGGMPTTLITNTSSFLFNTYGSTNMDVTFRLTARTNYQCTSDGRIRVSVYTG